MKVSEKSGEPQGHPETWDDDQAQLVIYEFGYQATGWRTNGDALLANTAAALAREYADAARDERRSALTPVQLPWPLDTYVSSARVHVHVP